MKRNRPFLYILIIALSCSIIYLSLKNWQLREIISSVSRKNEVCNSTLQKEELARVQNTLLREGFFQEIDFYPYSFDPHLIVNDTENGAHGFSQIVDGKATLFLFIYMECESCASANIKITKEYNPNTRFIISGVDGKKFKNFVRNNGIEDAAYHLSDDFDPFKLSTTVFLVITRNLEAKFLFAPNPQLPLLTEDYLYRVNQILN